MLLRPIQNADDEVIANIIREVLTELELTTGDCAFGDPQLDHMTATYAPSDSCYFVAEVDGVVVGGGGIAPLVGGDPHTCELQKLYLLSSTRGMGIGRALTTKLLEFAKGEGFMRCYLETTTAQTAAQSLYKTFGFQHLEAPHGNTGHTRCNVWMMLEL